MRNGDAPLMLLLYQICLLLISLPVLVQCGRRKKEEKRPSAPRPHAPRPQPPRTRSAMRSQMTSTRCSSSSPPSTTTELSTSRPYETSRETETTDADSVSTCSTNLSAFEKHATETDTSKSTRREKKFKRGAFTILTSEQLGDRDFTSREDNSVEEKEKRMEQPKTTDQKMEKDQAQHQKPDYNIVKSPADRLNDLKQRKEEIERLEKAIVEEERKKGNISTDLKAANEKIEKMQELQEKEKRRLEQTKKEEQKKLERAKREEQKRVEFQEKQRKLEEKKRAEEKKKREDEQRQKIDKQKEEEIKKKANLENHKAALTSSQKEDEQRRRMAEERKEEIRRLGEMQIVQQRKNDMERKIEKEKAKQKQAKMRSQRSEKVDTSRIEKMDMVLLELKTKLLTMEQKKEQRQAGREEDKPAPIAVVQEKNPLITPEQLAQDQKSSAELTAKLSYLKKNVQKFDAKEYKQIHEAILGHKARMDRFRGRAERSDARIETYKKKIVTVTRKMDRSLFLIGEYTKRLRELERMLKRAKAHCPSGDPQLTFLHAQCKQQRDEIEKQLMKMEAYVEKCARLRSNIVKSRQKMERAEKKYESEQSALEADRCRSRQMSSSSTGSEGVEPEWREDENTTDTDTNDNTANLTMQQRAERLRYRIDVYQHKLVEFARKREEADRMGAEAGERMKTVTDEKNKAKDQETMNKMKTIADRQVRSIERTRQKLDETRSLLDGLSQQMGEKKP